MFTIGKAKTSSWDDLAKMKEATFQIDGKLTILLRGVTEGERRKVKEDSTERIFNKKYKEFENKLNEDEFAYRLITTGWIDPEIPGETFEQKKESLNALGYGVIKAIAHKVDELSDIDRKDIEKVKNDLDLA